MIVRTLQESEKTTLFGNSDARLLVEPSDEVGHILIDTKIGRERTVAVEQEYLNLYQTQSYYCLSGKGICSIDGTDYPVKAGTLVAVTSHNKLVIKSEENIHIISIFCSGADISDPAVIVRNLEEVYDTERDIFWGNGRSRRLLIRKDGMGFSLCHTTGHSNTSSHIQYRNHLESCYYLSGTGEYKWDFGKHAIITGEKQSTVFIMDKHDTHWMQIEEESVCLSIFIPPIEGDEFHDFSNGKASSY